jgi:HAD superfamily hydrolase (TIGR01662 family)
MQQSARSSRRIRAVVFDVGETLIDESTEYGTWADWLGIPRHTFSSVFGQVIAQGRDYREVFQQFRPGFDLKVERERRAQAGLAEHFNGRDLYPDVRDCLNALKADGYFVGIAGNQTARAGRLLHELNLDVDMIATSDDWHVEKPSVEFFEALVAATGFPPHQIAYVGDRLDNDIQPAKVAGLATIFVKRGPWGFYYATTTEVEKADVRVDNLRDLPHALGKYNSMLEKN